MVTNFADQKNPQSTKASVRVELFAAVSLGLYALANAAQGLEGLPFSQVLSRMTTVFLVLSAISGLIVVASNVNRLKAAVPLLILLAVVLPSLLHDPPLLPGVATPGRLIVLVFLPAILAACVVQSARAIRFLFIGIGVQLALISTWTLLFTATASEYSDRITAVGLDTIVTANTLSIASVLLLLLASSGMFGRSVRILLLIGAFVLVVFMLQTQSRASIGILVLGIAIVWFVSPTRDLMLRLVAGLGLAGASWVVVSTALTTGRLASLSEDNWGERLLLWKDALRISAAHPAGIGWGAFGDYSSLAQARYPHNLLLQVMSEGGWLVMAVFLVILTLIVVRLIAAPAALERNLLLVTVAMTFFAAMFSSDVTGSRLLFVCLGATLGYTAGLAGKISEVRSPSTSSRMQNRPGYGYGWQAH